MIKAKHFWINQLFFKNYFRYLIWKDFHKMVVHDNYKEKNLPLLLICNHFSWWDGFFAYELNRRIFKRTFYLMMLEDQLNKYSFFRRLGAFSINPGNRSVINSLKYAGNQLKKSDNMLILFPQGQIQSQYASNIYFKKGWFKMLKNIDNDVHILFLANLTDYFSHRKPSLHIYMEDYPDTNGFNFDELSLKYNDFYKKCVNRQTEIP